VFRGQCQRSESGGQKDQRGVRAEAEAGFAVSKICCLQRQS